VIATSLVTERHDAAHRCRLIDNFYRPSAFSGAISTLSETVICVVKLTFHITCKGHHSSFSSSQDVRNSGANILKRPQLEKYMGLGKIAFFSIEIAVHLGNVTRYTHCYCGSLIVSNRYPITLDDLEWPGKAGREERNFSVSSPHVCSYRLTNSHQIWHANPCGEEACFRAQLRPYPKGVIPEHPILGLPTLIPFDPEQQN